MTGRVRIPPAPVSLISKQTNKIVPFLISPIPNAIKNNKLTGSLLKLINKLIERSINLLILS